MAQKVLFPGTYMRITQDEYSTYSHAGSMARDDGGKNTTTDSPVLAPFDGYVARVRSDSSHETYFVSSSPVQCANGYVGIVTFLFMHDNKNRVRTNQYFKQGDIIGYEGGFGYGRADAFAHHTHREWAKGKQVTQVRNSRGTYVVRNQMHEYDVCFLRPDTYVYSGGSFKQAKDFTGTIKDNMGHVFKMDSDGGSSSFKPFSSEDCTVKATGQGGARVSSGDVYLLKQWASDTLPDNPDAVVQQSDGSVLIGPMSSGDQVLLQMYNADQDMNLVLSKYEPPKFKPFSSEDCIVLVTGQNGASVSSGDIYYLKEWATSDGLKADEVVIQQADGSVHVGPLSSGDQILIQQYNADMGLNLVLSKYEPPVEKTHVRITSGESNLNVRTLPTADSVQITKVSNGEEYKFLDKQEGWYFIALEQTSGGWVSGDYVEEIAK